MRIDVSTLPKENWGHFLRARDLKQILANVEEDITGPVLEIGCGDGFLTNLLREKFGTVIPIDVSPRASVAGLCIADAEVLPFKDKKFGFVFSSNVLEHIEDLPKCFNELLRVAQDDAVMIHTMPTATWKILQLTLYPAHKIIEILGRLPRMKSPRTEPRTGDSELHGMPAMQDTSPGRRNTLQRLMKAVLPAPHGVAHSHAEEFKRFRRKWWTLQFTAGGLETYRTEPLYLHSAYRLLPYKGLVLRDLFSRIGLTSVRAYWLRKVNV